jgi:heme exporter protein B
MNWNGGTALSGSTAHSSPQSSEEIAAPPDRSLSRQTAANAQQALASNLWSLGASQALAILFKDVRAELRNRAALNSILLFSVTALTVVAFAVGTGSDSQLFKVALLWVVLFFAAFSGLSHVFIHEEEAGTSTALRFCALPGAVYVGKLLFNLLLLAVIGVVVVPLFVVLLDLPLERPGAFAAVLVSGCLGLGAAATIIAAIIAKARGKGALYGALGFPILLPLLFMSVNATRNTLVGDASIGMLLQDVGGLLSFAVMLVTASAMLFPFVWED